MKIAKWVRKLLPAVFAVCVLWALGTGGAVQGIWMSASILTGGMWLMRVP